MPTQIRYILETTRVLVQMIKVWLRETFLSFSLTRVVAYQKYEKGSLEGQERKELSSANTRKYALYVSVTISWLLRSDDCCLYFKFFSSKRKKKSGIHIFFIAPSVSFHFILFLLRSVMMFFVLVRFFFFLFFQGNM